MSRPDIVDAFGWNLKANILLLVSYGVTKVFIRNISRTGIPTDVNAEVEKPAFSIVFALIGGLFYPVALLFIRTTRNHIWPEEAAPEWWPVSMFVLSSVAIVILGVEMARRRLSALKTMSVQLPVLFVTLLGLLVLLGEMSGLLFTGAILVVGIFAFVEILSFRIARKIYHWRRNE